MQTISHSRTRQEFLSLDDERALIVKWQDHKDDASLQKLLESYQPFINKMARNIAKGGEKQGDLVSDGVLAIIEVIDRFQPQDNTRFLSYARQFIRTAMLDRLHHMESMVDVPRHFITAANKGRLPQAKGDSLKALAKKVSITDVVEVVADSQENCAADQLSQKQTISSWRDSLNEAFEGLPEEEKQIMFIRLETDNERVKDIAESLGVSASKARQIELRAMTRMKGLLLSQGFQVSELVAS